MNQTNFTRDDFIKTLYKDCEGQIELRAIKKGEKPKTKFFNPYMTKNIENYFYDGYGKSKEVSESAK